MPTSRFVVVSAPLEERVAASLASRVQGAVAKALRLRSEVNATLQREDLNERATEALTNVAEPGGLPFVLFLLLVAVLALRALLFRIETRRILKAHQTHTSGGAQAPTVHQHEE
tara:strand:+ start:1393 stop:1734 length:342 start_codon:yes stop_codon:yes gene_type:complete